MMGVKQLFFDGIAVRSIGCAASMALASTGIGRMIRRGSGLGSNSMISVGSRLVGGGSGNNGKIVRLLSSSSASTSPSSSSSAAEEAASSSASKPLPSLQSRSRSRKKKSPGFDLLSNKSSVIVLLRAGLPFILFCTMSLWVVSNAVGGKLKESEVSKGKTSKSLRQQRMEEEHDEMMERVNAYAKQDFDNTKRIKRPHEILEERRKEREKRNAWHRRAYRYFYGESDQPPDKPSK